MPFDRVREQLGDVLRSRLRSGLLVCIGATVTVMLTDLLVFGRVRAEAQIPRVLILGALIIAWRLSEWPGWQRSLRIAFFVVILYGALFATVGTFDFTLTARAYLIIALTMGTAAFLPWGGRVQLLSVVIVFAALAVGAYANAELESVTLVQLGQFGIVLGLTVFIAHELRRQTVARIKELLARQQKERALAEEAEVSSALVQVGREMLAVGDSPELLERLCRITAESLRCDSSHVFLWDPKDASYSCIAGYGDSAEQQEILRVLRVPEALVQTIVEPVRRDGLLQIDYRALDIGIPRELAAPFAVNHSIFIALRRRDELLGILTGGRRRSLRPFTAVEERIGRGIAQFATMSLQNVSLLESLRHANTLKSEFVATMSHELRTPLHILMGYGDLLRDGEFGEVNHEQQRILDLMNKNAHELLDLINTTLDLSRLETGRIRVDFSQFSIRELCDEVEIDLASAIRSHEEIFFASRVDADVGTIVTDKQKLKVVLKNLIGNAYKFTERGRIELRAELRERGVLLTISDTGPGIAADVQPIIFEAFHQGEASMTRSRGGVGLGLYIVRRLVAILHGKVKLAATGPRGSTFTVWLPLTPPATSQTQVPAESVFELPVDESMSMAAAK